MTDMDRELMQRYIYDVIRRLPKEQRQETGLELEGLIQDMMEAAGDEAAMEQILAELGEPGEFARRYRDDSGYLIGPEYFDNYVWVLKLVLFGVGISVIVSAVVNVLLNTGNTGSIEYMFEGAMDYLGDGVASFVGAFGAVTAIFAFMERKKIQFEKKKPWSVHDLPEGGPEQMWKPENLPPVPDKKSLIKRGDHVAGIIFLVIMFGILFFEPRLFGAWIKQDGQMYSIPVFNLAIWDKIFPLLLISFIAGLADECVKLAAGRYCGLVALSSIVSNMIQIAVAAFMLKGLPVWNTDFVIDLRAALNRTVSSPNNLLSYWNTDFLTSLILGLIVLCSCIEIVEAVYKSVRYGDVKR